MSTLKNIPVEPVNGGEKALVLHASSHRYSQALVPPPTAPSTAQSVEFDLLESLHRHWMMATIVFVLIAGVGTIWALRTTKPIYEAETTIFIPPDLGRDSAEGSPEVAYPTLVNQQVMTILHYDTLSDALQRLSKQGIAWRLKGETERQAVERLKNSLVVQRVPDSYEVFIGISTNDPRTAALIPNAVAQSFLDAGSRPDASGRSDRGTALFVEKTALEKELNQKMDLRAQLSGALQMVNPQKGVPLPDDEVLNQLRQALTAAHRKRIEDEEKLAAGPSGVAVEADQIANADPASRTVETNLLQQQFQLREKIKSMTPQHPVRKQVEAELAVIDAELQKTTGSNLPKITAQLMTKLKLEAAESLRVENDLAAEIARETAKIPGMSKDLAQADYVNAEIYRISSRLSRVEGQLEEINNRGASGSAMRVFSAAQPPTYPAKSQRAKTLSTVIGLALLLGLGFPVLLDLTDAKIYDPATVERLLGFPIAGMTIYRTAKTEQFADEHLRRLVAGIERGIERGARTIVLTGLKQPVSPSIIRDISRQLSAHNINVCIRAGRHQIEGTLDQQSRLIQQTNGLPNTLDDYSVVLMDAPALVFSADAERMASKADMTLVVVQSGSNTRPDLVRGARLLERLNVPAVGVILQDVKVERAGRGLRRDLKEYMALQRQLAGLAGSWVGW